MEILNYTNSIHDKDVNNIADCKLLYGKNISSECTKHINWHYYPILHICRIG